MDWEKIFTSIKAGQYERVYLFTGPEELMKREALAALRKKLLPPGLEQLNDATLEGVGAQEIIDCCEMLPVMCERRIVVVRDWAPLLSGKARNEEADAARMLDWLADPPESSILIFFMQAELGGKKELVKRLKKLACWVEFNQLNDAELKKWCEKQLKPLDKRINARAVSELNLIAGRELTRLEGELKKLAAYIGDRAEVGAEDVHAVVAPSPEYSVFMILDHLIAGRLAEASKVAEHVLQTEPRATLLIGLIASQLRIDAHMKYAMEERSPLPEVEKELKLSSGRSWHVQRQIRSIPAEEFRWRYQLCLDSIYDVRSGRVQERAALDALLLRLVWR